MFLFLITSRPGAWLRSKLPVLLLGLGVVAGALGLYHHEQKKRSALSEAKALSVLQAARIASLTEQIDRLVASQQISTQAVSSLNTQKEQLIARAKTRQAAVLTQVASIAASDSPSAQKAEQTSAVYIQSLWHAHCEAQAILCPSNTPLESKPK
jgi:flagellar biosynthesis regulator FlaF